MRGEQGPRGLGTPEQCQGQLIPEGGGWEGPRWSESPLHLLAAEFHPSASFKNRTPVEKVPSWKVPVILAQRKCLSEDQEQYLGAILFCSGSGKERSQTFGVLVSLPTTRANKV